MCLKRYRFKNVVLDAIDRLMEGGDIHLFSSRKRARLSHEKQENLLSFQETEKTESPHLPRPLADGVFPSEDIPFEKLGLSTWISNTCRVYGMLKPTDVQAVCIPAILEGRPVIGVAQTGSGKTATFALPILQKLAKDPYGIYALILTPTRELAFQIGDIFKALSAGMTFRQAVVVGGLKPRAQIMQLAKRPHVVVSTPGRLADIINSDGQLSGYFRRLAFLVIDEADQILDASFENDIRKILSILPDRRQTLLFSATMTQNLIRLQKIALPNAFVYEEMKTVSTLTQEYVLAPQNVKDVYLYHLLLHLDDLEIGSAIVFCATCSSCRFLSATLQHLGIEIATLHSDLHQRKRITNLEAFRSKQATILVATDLASRGLDIPGVDLVINFELPHLPRDYVHRVGRTARAGRKGRAISFVGQKDIDLVHAVEGMIGTRLVEYKMNEEAVLKSLRRVFVAKKAASLQIKREEKEQKDRSKVLNA